MIQGEKSRNGFEGWLKEVQIERNAKQRISPLPNDYITSQKLIRYILHTADSGIKRHCSYALLYYYRTIPNLNVLFYILDNFSKDSFIILLIMGKLKEMEIKEDEYLKLLPISKTLNSDMAKTVCKLRMLQSLETNIKGTDSELDEEVFIKMSEIEF